MQNTKKDLQFFKLEGKKLLQANPEITPGEVRNILEAKYGKMYWTKDGSVPKKGEQGFDFKFKPMGLIKQGSNAGKKNTFQIESLEVKKNRNVTNKKNRSTASDVQTIGVKNFPKVEKGSGLEAHHKRGLNLYRPIYEGLNNKQALSLSKWFVKQGFPLGDKITNADILPTGPHRHLHNYMEKEGYTEFKLPKFKKMSLAARKAWATNNFLSWAKDTERKTMDIMQKYQKQNPSKYQQLYKNILKTNKYNTISDVLKQNNTTFIPKNGNGNIKVNGNGNGNGVKVNGNGKVNGKVNGNVKANVLKSIAKSKSNVKGYRGTRDVIQTEIPDATANFEDLWESKLFGGGFGPPMRGV